MADDPAVSKIYEQKGAVKSLEEMQNGRAPFAEKSQMLRGPDGKVLGGTKSLKVQLNHEHALELMGEDAREVYDLDNLEIVSPHMHVDMTQ